MRLINADEVITFKTFVGDNHYVERDMTIWEFIEIYTKKGTVPIIDHVKTARWVIMVGMMPPEYHGHYECSNCGYHGKHSEKEYEYKYCPACGAKMDGVSE